VTYNHAGLTEQLQGTLAAVYGSDNLIVPPPITGAEDFSFFQEQVPGFFFFIGGRPVDVPVSEAIPNHSPYFYVDEGALPLGVHAMSRLAVDYLRADSN
jgi:amidohydrolase